MRLGLLDLLETIDIPEGKSRDDTFYCVRSVSVDLPHYFGRTNGGAPCLLLRVRGGSFRAPISLAGIEVGFSVPCKVSVVGKTEGTERFTVISCILTDKRKQEYFARVCETVIHIVGFAPSLDEVVSTVWGLVNLFQKLSGPRRRSVMGLFGELYVISAARSVEVAVAAWRNSTDERFDFSTGEVRLEVKASGKRQRIHEFSLEQCRPPVDIGGVLISLFVEESGGGTPLAGLVDRIVERLGRNSNLLFKLQRTIADDLGENVSTALSMRFDEGLAESSLQVYELRLIPAIREEVPAEVSSVRFRSDLSHTPGADIVELARRSRVLKDLLPS